MRIFIVSFLLVFFTVGSAWAQEEEKTSQVKPKNPHIQIMNDKAEALAKILTEDEAKSLGHIRENFGILRSIGVARESVGEAVVLCSKENPDLKDKISARHKKWNGDLGVALDKQNSFLDKSVNKEQFQDYKKVQDYLDTIDDAAEYVETHNEKNIVTTMEACEKLMESMDSTQEVIFSMLTEMSWPENEGATVESTEEATP